jgi:hypothetical protein
MAATAGPAEVRLTDLFRRCLVRPPTTDELILLSEFLARQQARFASGELDAARVAGPGEGNPAERAAWTTVARALLNLDETITKN